MAEMSVSIYMKGDYGEFHALGRRKNKANSKPNKLVLSSVEWSQSYLAPRFIWGLKTGLKKQSQFVPARNDTKPIMTRVYGDFGG